MSTQFHRGLTQEIRMRMQLRGVQLEEIDAQRALTGLVLFRSEAQIWLADEVMLVLQAPTNQELIRAWENEHPGVPGFPPTFAQVVLDKIAQADPSNPEATFEELKVLAATELLFG